MKSAKVSESKKTEINVAIRAQVNAQRERYTFERMIIECLNYGYPMTRNDLMQCVAAKSGRTWKVSTFSGALSAVIKKGTIRLYINYGHPIATKFYYCLPEWFTENELKKEYLNIMKEDVEMQT